MANLWTEPVKPTSPVEEPGGQLVLPFAGRKSLRLTRDQRMSMALRRTITQVLGEAPLEEGASSLQSRASSPSARPTLRDSARSGSSVEQAPLSPNRVSGLPRLEALSLDGLDAAPQSDGLHASPDSSGTPLALGAQSVQGLPCLSDSQSQPGSRSSHARLSSAGSEAPSTVGRRSVARSSTLPSCPGVLLNGFSLERDDEEDEGADQGGGSPPGGHSQVSLSSNPGAAEPDDALFGRWDRGTTPDLMARGRRVVSSGGPRAPAKPSLWATRQEAPPPAATLRRPGQLRSGTANTTPTPTPPGPPRALGARPTGPPRPQAPPGRTG